jgi:hypothetical protein
MGRIDAKLCEISACLGNGKCYIIHQRNIKRGGTVDWNLEEKLFPDHFLFPVPCNSTRISSPETEVIADDSILLRVVSFVTQKVQ